MALIDSNILQKLSRKLKAMVTTWQSSYAVLMQNPTAWIVHWWQPWKTTTTSTWVSWLWRELATLKNACKCPEMRKNLMLEPCFWWLKQLYREGNQALIRKLFGESYSAEIDESQCDDGFEDVQKAVLSGEISTVVPIEISRRSGHCVVREELILKTDVNQEEGSVFWHGLRLLALDISWLQKIHWVKHLRLARNGFKSLPNEIGSCLQQVNTLVYLSTHSIWDFFLLSLLLFHNAPMVVVS